MPWTDETLVAALQRRDGDAIKYAVELYAPKLYRYGIYELKDPAAAEDLSSDVITRMLERIDGFVYTGVPLQIWLFRIARNLVTDHYRRKGRASETSFELWVEESDEHQPGEPDIAVEMLGDRQLLQQAMSQLTEEQRQVLVLRLVEGWQPAEIAELLGRSIDSVKSLQYRALGSLRRYLEKEDSTRGPSAEEIR